MTFDLSWTLEREKIGKGMFKKWLGIIFVSLIICLVRKYVLLWNECHSPFFFQMLSPSNVHYALSWNNKIQWGQFFFQSSLCKILVEIAQFFNSDKCSTGCSECFLYILHQIVSYLYLCMFKCIYLLHHNDFIIKELFLCCDFWIY